MLHSRQYYRAMAIAVIAICLIGLLVGIVAKTAPVMAASQTYIWNNVVTGAGGGYVPGIIFNETTANLIYARTDIGGAYRWNESTQSWTQLLNWVSADNWNDTGVDALATDPVDPNRLYLLVGTYTNSWTSQNGAILRSIDRGNTFARISLPFKVGGNMPGRNMGERLVIDPNDNRILLLGARSGNGLWKSTDYGSTWSKVTSFPDPGQYAQDPSDSNGYLNDIMGIAWITFDKSTGLSGSATQTIYVGVADPNGTNIYRTTNGGSTWAAVPGQVTCTSSGGSIACTNGSSWTVGSECPQHAGIGLIPHHGIISPDRFLYVSYSDTLGPYDGDIGDVYKLNLADGAWTRISPRPSTAGGDCTNGLMDLLTGYSGISVDRQDPQTIMVSELNRWWPDVNFWRSTDGGATWTSAWDEAWPPVYTHMNYPDVSAAPWLNFGITSPPVGEPPVKLGWMVGDFEIDPFNSDRFFYGTGATIYGGTNLTAWDSGSKATVRVMARGVEETSVLDLVSPPSGSVRLLSGMGDIGGFRHTSLDAVPSTMYLQPVFSSTTDLDYAELSATFFVRVGNVDKEYNPNTNRAAFSYDGGSSWFQANSEPGGVTGGGTVAAAANASRVVWSPSGASVYYSTDNGNTWTAAQGIPAGAVVASDRVSPNKFYGLSGGTFYVSINGGASFTAAATGLPTSGEVEAVAGIEGDIWVVGGASDAAPWGMWHSTNSGASFTQLANVQGADSIGFGMAAPGRSYPAIYAAARVDNVRGIYRSDDGGATWVLITDSQHQFASIQTITGDPTIYGRVYVGTNGLGALYGDISGPTPTTVPPTSVPPTSVPPTGVPPTGVPPTSVPPTSVPPTTGPGICAVSYVPQNDWGSGATVNVTVKNNSTSTINGWTLTWTFPGNQQISQVWGGSYSQSGASVSVTNASYNRTIGANGGTASFGLNLTYSGTNTAPTNFALNGAACNGGPNPTSIPPTSVPPTSVPPTSVPPTSMPPTSVPPTSVPPTSVPPTSVPPTSVPPTTGPGVCSVTYAIQNDWGNGATVNVTIRNNGTSAINGWTLTWTFPGNQQISNLWNGSHTQSGASVSVRDATWNATIGANGGTVGFGFNISYSGSNTVPTGFRVNGVLCQ